MIIFYYIIMKYIIDYKNNLKGDGLFDSWCPLCGGPLNVIDYQIQPHYWNDIFEEPNEVNKEFLKMLKK